MDSDKYIIAQSLFYRHSSAAFTDDDIMNGSEFIGFLRSFGLHDDAIEAFIALTLDYPSQVASFLWRSGYKRIKVSKREFISLFIADYEHKNTKYNPILLEYVEFINFIKNGNLIKLMSEWYQEYFDIGCFDMDTNDGPNNFRKFFFNKLSLHLKTDKHYTNNDCNNKDSKKQPKTVISNKTGKNSKTKTKITTKTTKNNNKTSSNIAKNNKISIKNKTKNGDISSELRSKLYDCKKHSLNRSINKQRKKQKDENLEKEDSDEKEEKRQSSRMLLNNKLKRKRNKSETDSKKRLKPTKNVTKLRMRNNKSDIAHTNNHANRSKNGRANSTLVRNTKKLDSNGSSRKPDKGRKLITSGVSGTNNGKETKVTKIAKMRKKSGSLSVSKNNNNNNINGNNRSLCARDSASVHKKRHNSEIIGSKPSKLSKQRSVSGDARNKANKSNKSKISLNKNGKGTSSVGDGKHVRRKSLKKIYEESVKDDSNVGKISVKDDRQGKHGLDGKERKTQHSLPPKRACTREALVPKMGKNKSLNIHANKQKSGSNKDEMTNKPLRAHSINREEIQSSVNKNKNNNKNKLRNSSGSSGINEHVHAVNDKQGYKGRRQERVRTFGVGFDGVYRMRFGKLTRVDNDSEDSKDDSISVGENSINNNSNNNRNSKRNGLSGKKCKQYSKDTSVICVCFKRECECDGNLSDGCSIEKRRVKKSGKEKNVNVIDSKRDTNEKVAKRRLCGCEIRHRQN